ncbi:MAG: thioredoxin-like domain-containing protein [Carboxylicivirga sp.]|jgi:hypothetical protein|nr:thioredoxin-like domain-containing protein [Carboxylicivirga sp.]
MRWIINSFLILLLIACSKPIKTPYLTIDPGNQNIGVPELFYLQQDYQFFDRAMQKANENSFVFIKDSVPAGIYQLRIDDTPVSTLLISSSFPAVIKGDLNKYNPQLTITNNKETAALWNCKQLVKKLEDEIGEISSSIPDSVRSEQFLHSRDSIYSLINNKINAKAKDIKRLNNNFRNTLLPLLTIQLKAGNHYIFNPLTEADLIYETSNQLKTLYPDYHPVKALSKQVDSLMNWNLFNSITKEGRTLPDIKIPNAWNQNIAIDSLATQPTLFVLWSSNNAASRETSQQLMRWTRPYRSKGLQICMISFDTNRQEWLDAIKQDRLAVLHLSDLKGDESPVLNQLGLTSIPYLLLVDENKIIVKRTKILEELSSSLNQLMKN